MTPWRYESVDGKHPRPGTQAASVLCAIRICSGAPGIVYFSPSSTALYHAMNRWKAAAIHLTISLVLAAIVASLLYFLWFPSPYFVAAGASTLIMLLMGVDVCIGPLLTLLVVNARKPMRLIRLDLSIIGLVQAVAFGYGIYVISSARPVFVVAEVDRLVIVAADQLDDPDLAKGNRPEFRKRSWTGPVLVGALPPKDDKGADVAMQALHGGKDIDQLPAFYAPYDQVIDSLLQRAKPLAQVRVENKRQQDRILELYSSSHGDVLQTLPLERRDKDYTVVISSRSKRPFAVLSVDPWKH